MSDIDPVEEQRYNVRAAIPEHLAVFADWRRRSDDYKARCPGARLDLAYGDGPDETLDLFPAEQPDAPLVMLIHGGYWQALDKADNAFAAEALNAAGIGVAVVNYSLCPAVPLATIVDQMRRAALWLWRHAAELGCDPDRLTVVGHSAGGHLAAMLLVTDWPAMDGTAPRNLVRDAVAVSGLFDLEPLLQTSINSKVGLDATQARALSPIHHAPRNPARLLLAVGGAETAGFAIQAARLAEAWAESRIDMQRLTLPGANHLQAIEQLADAASPLLRATLAQIQASRPA